MNSARSSVDGPGYQLLPGKPLQNTWFSKTVKDQKNAKETLSSDRRDNAIRRPRPKQRTLSHVDKVQDLRSKLKEQQAKTKTTLPRSRSADVLDGQMSDSQGEGSVKQEDAVSEVDLWCDMETERNGTSSKLLSREPKIKSEKPTTKPILLGKYVVTVTVI